MKQQTPGPQPGNHTVEMPTTHEQIRQALLELEQMTAPPDTLEKRDYYGRVLWGIINDSFMYTLSPADLSLYQNAPVHLDNFKDPRNAPYMRILHALGEFVCERCIEHGDAKLSLCGQVSWLKFHWELRDPDLMEAYLNAAAQHSKIQSGRGHLEVAADRYKSARDLCGPQMEVMIKRFRAASRRRPPTNADFAAFFEKEFLENATDFQNLRGDAHKITVYVKNHPDQSFAVDVFNGRIEAEGFLMGMMARGSGLSLRSVQRKVRVARAGGAPATK